MDSRLTDFLDRLNEDQLRELNRHVVDRIRLLHERRAREAALAFDPGDRVAFDTADGYTVSGRVVRINRKTVTIDADDGRNWRVHPKILRRIVDIPKSPPATPKSGKADSTGPGILSNIPFPS